VALLSAFNQLIRRDLLRCGVLSKTAEIGGAQIHYYEAPGRADRPPTLLVHGFGDNANTWYQTLVPIARGLGRVVALDYPGAGFSTLPAGKDFETIPELIDSIEAFARETLGEPALLVGHSLGGAMALRMAAHQALRSKGKRKRSPPLWKGVLAISPAGAQLTVLQWKELRKNFEVVDRASARQLLGKLFSTSHWPLWVIENDIRALFRSPAIRGLLDSMDPADFLTPEELSLIALPCLILWGTEEQLLPADLVEYFRSHLPPHATLEVMKGWPHASQMERPRELAERIIRFGEAVFDPASVRTRR
jgi:pimeloyl-ACP methyl ester carboxylesterase